MASYRLPIYIYVAIVCTNTLGKLVLKIVTDGMNINLSISVYILCLDVYLHPATRGYHNPVI